MASEAVTHVCKANENFSKELYEIMCQNRGNIFYSSLSAHAILSLLLQGAAGDTASRLMESLHLSDIKISAKGYQEIMNALQIEEDVKLYIANKMFLNENYNLQDEFDSVARKYFWSEAESISFFPKSEEAAKKINEWVKNKTNNKIDGVVSANTFSKNTGLVLVNAIYFNGQWKNEFSESKTQKEKFYVSENEIINCNMMNIEISFQYAEDSYLEAQTLLIPYRNENLKMLIILPNSMTGIKELEEKLRTVNIRNLNVFSSSSKARVKLSLPKFKTEATIDMKSVLRKMGLDILFGKNCELVKILSTPAKISVSSVIQKAYIDVSEEGIEATAVTAVCTLVAIKGVKKKKPKCPAIIFRADHPFFFCICFNKESQFLPIFSGKVERPSLF